MTIFEHHRKPMVFSLVYSSIGLLVLTMGFKLTVFNRTRNFQWVMQLAHGHSAYARLILSFWFEVQGLQYLINDKHIQLPKFSLGFSPIMFWFMGGNPKHWVFGSASKDDNLRFCFDYPDISDIVYLQKFMSLMESFTF